MVIANASAWARLIFEDFTESATQLPVMMEARKRRGERGRASNQKI